MGLAEQKTDTTNLAPGTVLQAKYRIERVLGQGGLGIVYQARHLLLESDVAIKLLTDRDPANVARFLNEARATARIRSENIAQVMDVGTLESGQPFMVMELLDGRDLDQVLEARGRLPTTEAVDYILQALAGLSEAHAAGIVHRDMKPSNLFLARRGAGIDRVKLLDFGVAKQLFSGVSTVTSVNSVAGSPAYMAPEHLRAERTIDPRADLWSIGVILYELVTGQLPFFGENVGSVFAAILEQDPDPPSKLAAVDPGLEAVILKCLRRKPQERWASAVDLAEALVPYASEEGQNTFELLSRSVPTFRASFVDIRRSDPPTSTAGLARAAIVDTQTETLAPPPPPKRSRAWLAAAVLVVVVGGGVTLWWANRTPQGEARPAAITTTTTSPLGPATATTAQPAPEVTATATPAASATNTVPSTTRPGGSGATTNTGSANTTVVRPSGSATAKPSAAPSASPSAAPTGVDEDAIFQRH